MLPVAAMRVRSLAAVLPLLVAVTACASGDGSGSPPAPGDPGDSEPIVETESGFLRIEAPTPGQILGVTQVQVTGEVSAPGADAVTINGESFPIAAGRFDARVRLPEGRATVEVSAGDMVAHVDVWIDTTAPIIVIDSPQPGSFIEGNRLEIEGHVTDATLKELTVDGVDVDVRTDGSFRYERRVSVGAHRARVAAVDQAGYTSYAFTTAIIGRFAPMDEPVAEAMTLTAGTEAFRTLSDGATDVASGMDLEGLATSLNPVVSGWWGQIDVESLEHSPLEVDIRPVDGALTAVVVAEDVNVGVTGRLSGDLWASRAVLQASIRVTTWDGELVTELVDPRVMLEGFDMDIAWVPGFIEDLSVIRNGVRTRIESAMIAAVQSTVPGYLEDALSQIPNGGSVSVLGSTFDVTAAVNRLDITRHGIHATVDTGVRASVTELGRGLAAPGVLRLPPSATPEARGTGLGIGVSLDLVNAASFAAWSTGELTYRFDDPPFGDGVLQVSHLSLLAPGLSGVAPPDAPVSFVVSPALPPVAIATGSGLVQVELADLRVEAFARVDGEDVPLATLSIGATADAQLTVEDGALGVSLGAVDLTADVVEAPGRFPAGEDLDALLESAAADAIAAYTDIGGLRVPELYGFRVDAERAEVDGSYLRFDGELSYSP